MNFETSEWIAIIGILIASVFAILQLVKKTHNTNISQKSGPFSKGKQNINIKETKPDE